MLAYDSNAVSRHSWAASRGCAALRLHHGNAAPATGSRESRAHGAPPEQADPAFQPKPPEFHQVGTNS
jgi:hypothetical protein